MRKNDRIIDLFKRIYRLRGLSQPNAQLTARIMFAIKNQALSNRDLNRLGSINVLNYQSKQEILTYNLFLRLSFAALMVSVLINFSTRYAPPESDYFISALMQIDPLNLMVNNFGSLYE